MDLIRNIKIEIDVLEHALVRTIYKPGECDLDIHTNLMMISKVQEMVSKLDKEYDVIRNSSAKEISATQYEFDHKTPIFEILELRNGHKITIQAEDRYNLYYKIIGFWNGYYQSIHFCGTAPEYFHSYDMGYYQGQEIRLRDCDYDT